VSVGGYVGKIPVIKDLSSVNNDLLRRRVLVDVSQRSITASSISSDDDLPMLYVLNAATITKPHAVEHLAADLTGYKIDIAIISETHLKKKHADHSCIIDRYSLFRRDRRGDGVAVYVNNRMKSDVWTCSGDSPEYELIWIRVKATRREMFIGALYHPPKPLYKSAALLDYIETGVNALLFAYQSATVVLAGDFNALNDFDLISRTALCSVVTR
jgi:hypothetical protein